MEGLSLREVLSSTFPVELSYLRISQADSVANARSITHPHWFLVYPAEVDAQLPMSEKPYFATEPAGTTATDPTASETTVAERPASAHSSASDHVAQVKVGDQAEGRPGSRNSQV